MSILNEISLYEGVYDVIQKWKSDGIDISLIASGDKYLKLDKIVIPKSLRGDGVGSKVMNDIINLGDTMKRTITLTPSKDFGATSIPRLIKFYKRFGFIDNKGKNKDFDINYSMYRLPEGTNEV